jgi:hypothetical protein
MRRELKLLLIEMNVLRVDVEHCSLSEGSALANQTLRTKGSRVRDRAESGLLMCQRWDSSREGAPARRTGAFFARGIRARCNEKWKY